MYDITPNPLSKRWIHRSIFISVYTCAMKAKLPKILSCKPKDWNMLHSLSQEHLCTHCITMYLYNAVESTCVIQAKFPTYWVVNPKVDMQAVQSVSKASISISVHVSRCQQYKVPQRLVYSRHPSCAFTPRHLELRNITNLRGQLQRQVNQSFISNCLVPFICIMSWNFKCQKTRSLMVKG